MELSKQQSDIYNFVLKNNQSLLVDSLPGSGKTTTLIHSIIAALLKKGVPAEGILTIMFSKAIQVEFESKLLELNIPCKTSTCHALGFNLLRNKLNCRMDKDKLKKLGEKLKVTNWDVYKLVTLAKSEGVDLLKSMVGTAAVWNQLALDYSYELDCFEISQARRLFDESNKDLKTCDFGDMIYLPVQEDLKSDFKTICIDEMQDFSPLRIEFLKTVFSNSTIYGAGDPNQSIFGFTGSDENAMAKIQDEFKAHKLPLDISWRCSKDVTLEANKLVPNMRFRPGAPQGEVRRITIDEFNDYDFSLDTFILCRLNAPLLGVLFSILARGYKARIQGKDIGEELINLSKKWKWKEFSDLIERLKKYLKRQKDKMLPENARAYAALQDKINVLLFLVNKSIEKGKSDREGLYEFIRGIFKDEGDGIVLSTVHKAKGLERKEVFIWGEDKYKANWIRHDWERREEKRIKFVAITRAKNLLFYVDLENDKPNKKPSTKLSTKLPQKGEGNFKGDFLFIEPNSDKMDF